MSLAAFADLMRWFFPKLSVAPVLIGVAFAGLAIATWRSTRSVRLWRRPLLLLLAAVLLRIIERVFYGNGWGMIDFWLHVVNTQGLSGFQAMLRHFELASLCIRGVVTLLTVVAVWSMVRGFRLYGIRRSYAVLISIFLFLIGCCVYIVAQLYWMHLARDPSLELSVMDAGERLSRYAETAIGMLDIAAATILFACLPRIMRLVAGATACLRCAYPLSNQNICPECGTRRSSVLI